ncbi:MAG: hypothetical protein A3H57_03230 [Candidatus Taylorbacteria bacterium RIFCSPLOWO2_02_FULL_43_11]|uniref:Endolytic murein transglycosylase n=1 Tax=Candidatus Taylorbacteria bacterium RIFCSPHIGHO2_02_FULL_43_32b TaxID=1802306 RepID=A0A1G2MI12_9BACT|nr:MAG: hypothetical protein A2743_00850 [Candidatus Taylorbacteria bacterium RIFCSPHIGHO2_01_FULL_43_47]OHA22671.1 MAG: hypothetical protein A3C72_01275 [Candidatus Taylorbacteria bacterium RIFCSPHIGHO2_02_FULL_43_32b]OHA36118.1 MAG: hypothetical protein A3H57_03230 [Candidatus Taylorbacteria bacterium RIFCSPLOWO2_02_FULL_43_11]
MSIDNPHGIKENFFFDKYRQLPEYGRRRFLLASIALMTVLVCYRLAFAAPSNFPQNKVVEIPSGTSLLAASDILEKNGVIRSDLLFRMLVRVLDGQKGVKAGDYFFDKKQNIFTVASRLVNGDRGFSDIAVVIPEGTSAREIAEILSKKIRNFDKEEFLRISLGREGYLFPDTYHFTFDSSEDQILNIFLDNFEKKIAPLKPDIEKFGRSLTDVIKMASIIEEEGRLLNTRKTIAGILWKRFDIGMPLQVDAAFLYTGGKNTFELTKDDLEKDSPYNTYTRAGLPPTPISNPGLDSIVATMNPIKTSYLYYLTDRDGVMHYAMTHDEHVINKERYLR